MFLNNRIGVCSVTLIIIEAYSSWTNLALFSTSFFDSYLYN